MAVPLKKDDQKQELTTADLAQGKGAEPAGPKPVASERAVTEVNRSESQTSTPLFPNNELENLRTRWKEIQTNFVDEPRKAVEQGRCT